MGLVRAPRRKYVTLLELYALNMIGQVRLKRKKRRREGQR